MFHFRSNDNSDFECTRQGYYRNPNDCSRFYRCVKFDQYIDDYTVFEYDCPSGLVFDDRWEVCAWPSAAPPCDGSSEIFPVPQLKNVCPSDGFYADPENCRWFFACKDYYGNGTYMQYEFRCPFGLAYDEENGICNWSWLVDSCGDAGIDQQKYQNAQGSIQPIPVNQVAGGFFNGGGNRGQAKHFGERGRYSKGLNHDNDETCLECGDSVHLQLEGEGVYDPQRGIIVGHEHSKHENNNGGYTETSSGGLKSVAIAFGSHTPQKSRNKGNKQKNIQTHDRRNKSNKYTKASSDNNDYHRQEETRYTSSNLKPVNNNYGSRTSIHRVLEKDPVKSSGSNSYVRPEGSGKKLKSHPSRSYGALDISEDKFPAAVPAASYGIPQASEERYPAVPSTLYGAPHVSEERYPTAPSTLYGAPHVSQERFPAVAPSTSYGVPQDSEERYPSAHSASYGVPQDSEERYPIAPSASYGVPHDSEESHPITPSASYGVPKDSRERYPTVPSTLYGAPQISEERYASAPSASYGVPQASGDRYPTAPSASYGVPQDSEESYHSVPSTNYGPPKTGKVQLNSRSKSAKYSGSTSSDNDSNRHSNDRSQSHISSYSYPEPDVPFDTKRSKQNVESSYLYIEPHLSTHQEPPPAYGLDIIEPPKNGYHYGSTNEKYDKSMYGNNVQSSRKHASESNEGNQYKSSDTGNERAQSSLFVRINDESKEKSSESNNKSGNTAYSYDRPSPQFNPFASSQSYSQTDNKNREVEKTRYSQEQSSLYTTRPKAQYTPRLTTARPNTQYTPRTTTRRPKVQYTPKPTTHYAPPRTTQYQPIPTTETSRSHEYEVKDKKGYTYDEPLRTFNPFAQKSSSSNGRKSQNRKSSETKGRTDSLRGYSQNINEDSRKSSISISHFGPLSHNQASNKNNAFDGKNNNVNRKEVSRNSKQTNKYSSEDSSTSTSGEQGNKFMSTHVRKHDSSEYKTQSSLDSTRPAGYSYYDPPSGKTFNPFEAPVSHNSQDRKSSKSSRGSYRNKGTKKSSKVTNSYSDHVNSESSRESSSNGRVLSVSRSKDRQNINDASYSTKPSSTGYSNVKASSPSKLAYSHFGPTNVKDSSEERNTYKSKLNSNSDRDLSSSSNRRNKGEKQSTYSNTFNSDTTIDQASRLSSHFGPVASSNKDSYVKEDSQMRETSGGSKSYSQIDESEESSKHSSTKSIYRHKQSHSRENKAERFDNIKSSHGYNYQPPTKSFNPLGNSGVASKSIQGSSHHAERHFGKINERDNSAKSSREYSSTTKFTVQRKQHQDSSYQSSSNEKAASKSKASSGRYDSSTSRKEKQNNNQQLYTVSGPVRERKKLAGSRSYSKSGSSSKSNGRYRGDSSNTSENGKQSGSTTYGSGISETSGLSHFKVLNPSTSSHSGKGHSSGSATTGSYRPSITRKDSNASSRYSGSRGSSVSDASKENDRDNYPKHNSRVQSSKKSESDQSSGGYGSSDHFSISTGSKAIKSSNGKISSSGYSSDGSHGSYQRKRVHSSGNRGSYGSSDESSSQRHSNDGSYNRQEQSQSKSSSSLSTYSGHNRSKSNSRNSDQKKIQSYKPQSTPNTSPYGKHLANPVSLGVRVPVIEGPSIVAKLGGYESKTYRKGPQRFGPGGFRDFDDDLGPEVCERAGLFRHPDSCDKFYECYWDRWVEKFTLHVFDCPVTIVYDSGITACNWPFNGPPCTDERHA